jgi:hypothetical protein
MPDTVLFIFASIFGVIIVLSIAINLMDWNYNRKHPPHKITSIEFRRVVPSFYGLCGLKVDVLVVTDPLLIHDWELEIYRPKGYHYVCTNYELELIDSRPIDYEDIKKRFDK